MAEQSRNIIPFFMTHHSPVGAWASLTFGLPGHGVSVDLETPGVEDTADLIVAVSRGSDKTIAFPFATGISTMDNETRQTTRHLSPGSIPQSWKDRWRIADPGEMTRRLTPCIDQYTAGEMTLRILSPHPSLPDPETGESLIYATCPGILLELSIDNSQHNETAHGFLGLGFKSRGRVAPLDWSMRGELCGVAFSNQWALAAMPIDSEVFTIRDNNIAFHVEHGKKVLHNGGQEGGIAFRIPAGEKRTLTAAFGFYREGPVTQGICGRYFYNRYFRSLHDVCTFLLENADRIRRDCAVFDDEVAARRVDPKKYQLFCQSIRAYYASTQLIEADGRAYYNVGEGQYLWRNTMDLAADHVPFELWRNPWVVRNILDLYIEHYTYHDEVRFGDEPGKRYPGGLSFTHDMGSYTTYTPFGSSGYEMIDSKNYGYMTTEELLNGIYCISAYALSTREQEWLDKHSSIGLELMASMENRDHYDPARRNGIIKAESLKCGDHGREITTYDCLDHSLMSAVGNLYIAVKTFCAGLLLADVFRLAGRPDWEARARKMADRTRVALPEFFDESENYLKANLYQETPSKIMAAIEPFAVPLFLGLKPELTSDLVLNNLLIQHIRTCMQKGNCIDAVSEGLRLSSASVNTWPSKTVLCAYVMEEMFGIDLLEEYPTIMRELLHWTQVSAAEKTISDQIDAEKRTVIGAFYYPRIITSALWVISSAAGLPVAINPVFPSSH